MLCIFTNTRLSQCAHTLSSLSPARLRSPSFFIFYDVGSRNILKTFSLHFNFAVFKVGSLLWNLGNGSSDLSRKKGDQEALLLLLLLKTNKYTFSTLKWYDFKDAGFWERNIFISLSDFALVIKRTLKDLPRYGFYFKSFYHYSPCTKKGNENKIILLRDTWSCLMGATSPIKTKHTAGSKIHLISEVFKGVHG